MIDRNNWKLTKAFLAHRGETGQLSEDSLQQYEKRLRHLLEWADDKSFKQVNSIRPPFREYLDAARSSNNGKPFSPAYKKKIIAAAYQFGSWLVKNRNGYRSGLFRWLDTLSSSARSDLHDGQHEAVSVAEVEQIAAAPTNELWQKRIQAAAVFWFLSGIRIGAFVTLPLLAVDIYARKIHQWPELGVETKFGKRRTTFLLNIPHLLHVVEDWDRLVRQHLPDTGYWFPPLSSKTGEICSTFHIVGKHRTVRARKDLKKWLAEVALPYHSPHKFRHGFAVHALKLAQDMADYKAVSMNLMHANLSITDGIYAILSEQDISERIASLGEKEASSDELVRLLKDLAKQLESRE